MSAAQAEMRSVRERVSEREWRTRVDLAAAYRLVALFGWDDLVFTHVSARVPGADHHFLINPFGLMFEEITASNLVKVDHEARIVMETPYPVNPAGFMIHSTVHAARADALCVMHLHTTAGVAVAAQREGLLPISQQAAIALSSLSYHDYEGVALDDGEKPRLTADLGDSRCLILRNHGLLTVGGTAAEAFVFMYNLQRACEIQVAARPGGAALVHVDPHIIDRVGAQVQSVTKGMGAEIVWPALLRKLDRIDASFRQ
jgi:ribulose-5-phosphate 4-epimerase/fuculose-1-phosphate aldolase